MSRASRAFSKDLLERLDTALDCAQTEQALAEFITLLSDSNVTPQLLDTHLDKEKTTLIHKAAGRGQTEAARALLSAGASHSPNNSKGRTPLHEAAFNGHAEAVKVLFEAGASHSVIGKEEKTPIHMAASNGHAEVIKVLIGCGASPNVFNAFGTTPMHMAASNGNDECIKALVETGASHSPPDKDGNTPIHSAANGGHPNTIRVLVAMGASHSALNKYSKTPLYYAAAEGQVRALKALLSAGANPSIVTLDFLTPLGIAVINRQYEAALLLVEHGADPNAKISDSRKFFSGKSAIEYLMEKGEMAQAEALSTKQKHYKRRSRISEVSTSLSLPASPTTPSPFSPSSPSATSFSAISEDATETSTTPSQPPLSPSAGRPSLLWKMNPFRKTLKRGNSISSDMGSARQKSLREKPEDLAVATNGLKRHNSSVTLGDSSPVPQSPDSSALGSNRKLNSWLMQLKSAIERYDELAVSELLRDPEAKRSILMSEGPEREFPLYWAAKSGSLSMVEGALAVGARVTQRTAKGWTALHVVAFHGHLGLIDSLKEADINAITKLLETPLHVAAKQGNAAMVHELIARNANVLLETIDGDTALTLAEGSRHAKVIRVFHRHFEQEKKTDTNGAPVTSDGGTTTTSTEIRKETENSTVKS